ncbi:hypothetical protein BV25DRAFT_985684 [Artomyces pyxidatus]|uniref:Uncharacterized protein n=1 Tax=Artomyces pyxidatus TaxID=48021 RepID=A0ACB8SWS7_9AGAM|nr:hypothetical protein BV25DRAFT_985684 [Artomyces pyxidatus]
MKTFREAILLLPWAIGAASMALPGSSSQVTFTAPMSWDSPPNPDATHHLVFNTVSSLLQRWPNTIYRNGHTVTPATISAGTILYHGRRNAIVPTTPEWLAFDFEHSHMFCRSSCYVISLMATRDLRLVYFDGSNAAKMRGGPMDSQDILIWEYPHPERTSSERIRISELCAWGKPFSVDGFVRMEYHFEVMLCDFSAGTEVVTLSNLIPVDIGSRRRDAGSERSGYSDPPTRRPRLPPKRPDPPTGWKGSLPTLNFIEVLNAGSWHNQAPGETRVHIDYSGVVTFYNPSLTSLVEARRGQPRSHHRLANISKTDSELVRQELAEVFARQVKGPGGGIDWGSITHVIVKRYSERLELLQYLLEPATYTNVTEQAVAVRIQILTMLAPYITTEAVRNSSDTSWVGSIVHYCSTTQTSMIPGGTLTPQERLIRDAVEGTLHEICRRLTLMWVDAFDIEAATDRRKAEALGRWRVHVRELMEWLDWSVWNKCNPACGIDALCHVPTWPFVEGDHPDDMTPRCISRVRLGELALEQTLIYS